jgi:hypothetical protein
MMPRMQKDGPVVQLHNLVRDHPDFEVLCAPASVYCFRYVPNGLAERQEEAGVHALLDRLNEEIVEAVQRSSVTAIRIRGRVAIQVSIGSQEDDVDATFETIARWGRLLNKKLSVRYETTSDMEEKLCSSESHFSLTEVSAT